MPPKKQVSGKNEQKKKEKVADDKTFGMKNKKGKKQQEQIKQIKQQVQGNQKDRTKMLDDKRKAEELKKQQKGNFLDKFFITCRYWLSALLFLFLILTYYTHLLIIE